MPKPSVSLLKLLDAYIRADAPHKTALIDAIVNLTADEDKNLGQSIRDLCENGIVGPSFNVLSDTYLPIVLDQYMALRLMPRTLGVTFGIGCIEHDMHYFIGAYPSEKRPSRLLVMLKRWSNDEISSNQILELESKVEKIYNSLESKLEKMFSTGQMDKWTENERNHSYLPLKVLQLLVTVSSSATLPGPDWVRNLEDAVNISVEISSMDSSSQVRQDPSDWHKQLILNIIGSYITSHHSD